MSTLYSFFPIIVAGIRAVQLATSSGGKLYAERQGLVQHALMLRQRQPPQHRAVSVRHHHSRQPQVWIGPQPWRQQWRWWRSVALNCAIAFALALALTLALALALPLSLSLCPSQSHKTNASEECSPPPMVPVCSHL